MFERAWAISGDGQGRNKTFAFGLRYDPSIQSSKPIEERVYELYPRRLSETTYEKSTQNLNGKPVTLYLFSATSAIYKGLRVTDADCYVKLVDEVLNKSQVKHVSKVNDLGHFEFKGEILMLGPQKTTKKLGSKDSNLTRWGWGLGWGLPFWGR